MREFILGFPLSVAHPRVVHGHYGLGYRNRAELRKHLIIQYLAVVWPVIEGSCELTPGVVTYPDSIHSSMFVTVLSVCAVYSEKLREGL